MGARVWAAIGLVLVLAGRVLADEPAVAYTLELLPGPAVRVSLRVAGEADGTSRLAATENWGGIRDCERFVHGLEAREVAGGKACPVERDPADPHAWQVRHGPGAVIEASYELRPAPKDPLSAFGTHYEPVVRDDLFHMIGQTGLVYPAWLAEAGPVEIATRWRGFSEQGWEVAGSFEAEQWRVRRTLDEYRQAMFLAGKVRPQEREIPGGRLKVAVYGDGWGFQDAELADLAQRVVAAEREFVGGTSEPFFLITVVPAGPPAGQGFSMGGTGLTNCFALFMAPGAKFGAAGGGPAENRERVLHLLAHEYFHTWIGGKTRPQGPEELQYWFSEGFTEFFAARVLLLSGLVDESRWLARTNETLRNLWTSPVRTEPAESIRRGFWSGPDLQRLPYLRGEVVALCLDEEIRRTSGGTRTIDDFLRELLADAAGGSRVDTDRLLERIARWTSDGFADSVRRVVVEGALPDPPARLTRPAAERTELVAYTFDAGFDIDATVKTRTVSGVREPGPAHAAGLRDGQAIAGMNIHSGDADHAVMIKVRDGDAVRTIEYLPRGGGQPSPAYRLLP